jgi:hypothetical protein
VAVGPKKGVEITNLGRLEVSESDCEFERSETCESERAHCVR